LYFWLIGSHMPCSTPMNETVQIYRQNQKKKKKKHMGKKRMEQITIVVLRWHGHWRNCKWIWKSSCSTPRLQNKKEKKKEKKKMRQKKMRASTMVKAPIKGI
jgi:hypothetical protein